MGGRAGEDPGIAGVRVSGQGVESLAAGRCGGRVVVQEHHEVAEEVQGFVGAAGRRPLGADLRDDGAGLAGVVRGDVTDVGGPGHQSVGDGRVGQGADDRLALRRAGVIEGPLTLKCLPSKSM